jgi:calmodulin|eukprot:CAMPEP_0174295138 /NCGR_PEP_ID=MMETSP0809-20121228/43754_1 /TAXON_ID=73025 ORGANISM="Eutreptiella gymnastica-like, Strain CCMP1594" /NCGR_SAMPLE_ID=MMETSP0809 /ASSEMBLY_ACC=CAM_ASM_000658 /LENGTH=156 /DNA_ID=CAMNT_0015397149 /DNA_START=20 /DNA_END=493 /DNA_ORIENTATION=+
MSVSDLPQETVQEVRDVFTMFDKDRSDTIPLKELGTAMRAAGTNPTEQELLDIIADVDGDSTGQIDFQQFLSLVTRKMQDYVSEEELKTAFQTFDRDGMGYITDTELRIVMCTLGDKLTPEEMNELLTEVECDAEGNVNYEEFCKKLAPEKPPPIK